jgi:hypothetical protein
MAHRKRKPPAKKPSQGQRAKSTSAGNTRRSPDRVTPEVGDNEVEPASVLLGMIRRCLSAPDHRPLVNGLKYELKNGPGDANALLEQVTTIFNKARDEAFLEGVEAAFSKDLKPLGIFGFTDDDRRNTLFEQDERGGIIGPRVPGVSSKVLAELSTSARRTAALMKQCFKSHGPYRLTAAEKQALRQISRREAERLGAEGRLLYAIDHQLKLRDPGPRPPLDEALEEVAKLADAARRKQGQPPKTALQLYILKEHDQWVRHGGTGKGVGYRENAEGIRRDGDPRGLYKGPFLDLVEANLHRIGYSCSRDSLAQAILRALKGRAIR